MTSETTKAVNVYRERAVAAARRAAAALAATDVTVLVTGSLAGGRFGPKSDVDFLITRCPRPLKYTIESIVEDLMDGIPFDVVYLDELPNWKVPHFMKNCVSADELC